VLGAILVHTPAFQTVAEKVRPEDFYRDAHRRIFKAMATLIDEKRVVVDFVTLKEELLRVGDLDEVGGPAYISSLADGVPRATNVVYYAGIVREKAILRSIIFAGNKMLHAAYGAEESSTRILSVADRSLLELQHGRGHERLIDIRKTTTALFADLSGRVENRGALLGIDTGFASLNELGFGWQAGDLIVIAARPSMGKTAFELNTCIAAARQGKRVAMFSLEMRLVQLQYRMLSILSGVMLSRILGGHLASSDYSKISAAFEELATLPIFINDRSGQSLWEIRNTCRRLKSEGGLDLVSIDYFQLMPGELDVQGATRTENLTDISRRAKELADEIQVPIHLLSQLNRAGAKRVDRRPILEDLRDCGALEQDADVVMFLHRKSHRESGTTNAILEKQRNGATGTVNLTFDRDIQTFTDGGEDVPEERPTTTRARRQPSFYESGGDAETS
jgi:replicative DNA helicase